MNTQTSPDSQASKTKIKRCDVFDTLISIINKDDLALPGWKLFPNNFYVLQADASTRVALQETHSGIVSLVKEAAVRSAIASYCKSYASSKDDAYRLDHEGARSCARYWLDVTPPVKPPALVNFLSDKGLCFSRLPFDLKKNPNLDNAPIFKEFLLRCTNAEALCAWIGSLLVPESDRQQYIWMYGQGEDSKGSIARLLDRVFGCSYVALYPPTLGGVRFFNSQIVGKRLGVFPDCNDTDFVTSGHFKSLTGGDAVPCEDKGMPSYKTSLLAKYMFLSNEKPNISSERADMRRIIYCEISSPGSPVGGGSQYDAALWAEAQEVISHCSSEYRRLCPTHGYVPVNQEPAIVLANENEAHFYEVFERRLNHVTWATSPENACSANKMASILEQEFPRQRKIQAAFRSFMKRHYGVSPMRNSDHKWYTCVQPINYTAY